MGEGRRLVVFQHTRLNLETKNGTVRFHELNPDVTVLSWKRRQDFVGGGEVAAGLERTDRYKKKPTEK